MDKDDKQRASLPFAPHCFKSAKHTFKLTKSRVEMSSSLLVLIIIGLASLQPTLCQDDSMDSRAQKIMSDGTGAGQSRQLHSQKHFSPHRMMHFGKRPLTPLPPALPDQQQQQPPTLSGDLQVLPLVQQKRLALVDEEQERLIQQAANGYLPYSLVYDTPREQVLEATSGLDAHRRDKHLMDIVEHLLQFSKQQKSCNTNGNKRQQQVDGNQQQEIPERMMKLMNGETDSSYELAASIEKLQQQQQQPADQTNDQPQQTTGGSEQDDAINVVGRSVQRPRAGEPFDLTKAHISSLLFGRRITEPPSSLMSLGGFIKKNEPQRMTFMHFG